MTSQIIFNYTEYVSSTKYQKIERENDSLFFMMNFENPQFSNSHVEIVQIL